MEVQSLLYVTMIIEENTKLFPIDADGSRQFFRNNEKPQMKLQQEFKQKTTGFELRLPQFKKPQFLVIYARTF